LSPFFFHSPNIARQFGKPGPSEGEGQRIVSFLIDQIKTNFGMWNADEDVLVQVGAQANHNPMKIERY
jgi:hypothetical protein